MKLTEGWEVVQGEMQEAIDIKGMGGDTTRRLGDVILMRCRKDRYVMLQRREDAKRKAQQDGVTAGLRAIGDRHAKDGVIVHTDLNSMHPKTVQRMANRAAAQQKATEILDQHVREGRVPGMPAPGTA